MQIRLDKENKNVFILSINIKLKGQHSSPLQSNNIVYRKIKLSQFLVYFLGQFNLIDYCDCHVD